MSARSKTGRRTEPADRRPRESAAAPEDLYKREKARRGQVPDRDAELLAAAKKEYLALLAQDAVKGKGGRPKKKATPPATARPDADTESEDDATDLDE
jgi:hypothetical protein